MSQQFVLNSFLEHGQKDSYYRLDIVRGVSFETAYDPSMPFQVFIVNFSRYSDEYQSLEKIKNIPAKDIFKSYQIDITANLSINIDVTNLIFLKPGSVWKNGSSVWESTELTNIAINQAEASGVSFYQENNLGTKMPFIYKGNGVQFLKFPNSKVNGKVVTVLIPTTEVIRYYFSGSTYFTTELFNGALKGFEKSNEASRLFYKYHFDESAKEVYIWLKRHCYDSDAIMIARGLADPGAMNAMNYIYASLVNAKINFKTKNGHAISEACPRTKLPFSGGTNLDALGQWLPPRDGEDEFTTYVVRTIEDCEHPLPFKKIKIESVDSYKPSGKVDENSKSRPSKPRRATEVNDDGEQKPPNLTDGERPTNKIAPEELKFMMQRFSHLSDVKIEKVEKVSENEKQRYYQKEVESDSNEGSSLPADCRKDNHLQAWNNRIIDSETIPVSGRLLIVSNAVASIVSKEEWVVQALPPRWLDAILPYGLYSFERPSGKSGRYEWHMVEGRNRRALFLAISNNDGQTVYLLEIEGKGDVSYSLFLFKGGDAERDQSYFARSLLYRIADASGAKIKDEILNEFIVTSMKHTESENDSFEERLHRAIAGVFEEAKK